MNEKLNSKFIKNKNYFEIDQINSFTCKIRSFNDENKRKELK